MASSRTQPIIIQYVYFVNKITSFESFRELLNKKDLEDSAVPFKIFAAFRATLSGKKWK